MVLLTIFTPFNRFRCFKKEKERDKTNQLFQIRQYESLFNQNQFLTCNFHILTMQRQATDMTIKLINIICQMLNATFTMKKKETTAKTFIHTTTK